MANMTLIKTEMVGVGGAAFVTLTAIPQTYTDLKVLISVRGTANIGVDGLIVEFNGNATGYTMRRMDADGASVQSATNSSGSIAILQGANTTANTFGNYELYIPNYTSSNNKSVGLDGVNQNNATTEYSFLYANLWSNSAAITSIKLTPASGSLVEGSTFYLYGIANAAILPNAKATGGAIYQDDTYFYHMFTSTGVLTPSEALSNVDYLVVAGGGGGGYGGGGGAGGLRCTVDATGGGGSLPSKISLASGTGYTVTIGAGGSGNNSYSNAFAGGNSSLIGGAISITSTGGGRGGGTGPTVGGSGGGYGNNTTGTGAAGTADEGRAGGNGDSPRGGGGGGGALLAGQNGNGAAPGWAGNGGNGVLTTIGGNATYYAGGGGGAYNGTANVYQGQGGLGGGGTGGINGAAGSIGGTNGIAATGGGGGASNMNSNIGGNGGSGIVIVRYAK